MNRKIRVAVAATAVGALVVLSTAPSGAQAALEFEIDITEGRPGDLVNGQVNPDDVAANCNFDANVLSDRFGTAADTLLAEVDDVFFPGGFDPVDPADFRADSFEQLSWLILQFTADNVNEERAEEALPQTFVMTFADIATQDPVGERVNFDPAVGEATLTVPDVTPGPWAVAATCVSPSSDPQVLADAVRANVPLVEEWLTGGGFEEAAGIPFPGLPITDPELFGGIGFLGASVIGESLVPAMVAPDALGAQVFCVQDASGACPQPPTPGPGEPPGEPPTAPPAQPVPGRPTFTG